MMRIFRIAAIAALVGLGSPAFAAGSEIHIPEVKWSFDGLFGTFDRASAQRGFQVYKEVCSSCHSIKYGYYRDLRGLGLTAKEVEAVASGYMLPTTDDSGQPAERTAVPSDKFRLPFPNEKAARAANNGALPPDLSVMVKARENGSNYVHALLTGYEEPPATMTLGTGMYYNKYFAGNQIGMPQPLRDGQVEYADGTKATIDQMSQDVTMFLTYIANPELETRKAMGVKVILFLIGLTCVTYAVKRKIWADVEH